MPDVEREVQREAETFARREPEPRGTRRSRGAGSDRASALPSVLFIVAVLQMLAGVIAAGLVWANLARMDVGSAASAGPVIACLWGGFSGMMLFTALGVLLRRTE